MCTPAERYAEAHRNRNGAGDARPTALEIVQDEGMVGKLVGRVMMVTGASDGIGVETARALHATGADLFLPVRSIEKGERVKQDILRTSPGRGALTVLEMDLQDLGSVRRCAAAFLQKSTRLNVLVNNAGIMATPTRVLTKDGHELQFATNHLAHFLLFQLLKPALLSSTTLEFPSRVVCVSSSGHRGGGVQFDNISFERDYTPWAGYAQSKTANIHMSNQIERLYGSRGLHSTSVMPGGIATNLQRDTPYITESLADPFVAKIVKSRPQGAATTVLAAIGSEWADKGGRYLENELVAAEYDKDAHPGEPGVNGRIAYDQQAEERLWRISCDLVGVSQND